MFPTDTLVAYLLAVLLVVLAPGPDNILAVSRGLGQGRMAATLSSLGAGLGIARVFAEQSLARRRASRRER